MILDLLNDDNIMSETKTLNKIDIEIENKNVFPNISAGTTALVAKEEEKINELSSSVEGQFANIADRLLANQKIADAGVLGTQLNQLISTAKEFDPSRFKKKGIFSKIVNALSGAKDQILAHSDTVNERIERVVKEIDKQINLHENRQQDLDDLMVYNQQYHEHLTNNIEKGKALVQQLEAKKAEIDQKVNDQDTFAAADSFAIQNQIVRVHALIQEFENSRMRSKQVAIELETMKQSGTSLIQTVKVAKQSLIPNWKMALIQFIMSTEQEKTASYATSLNKANDEALKALGSKIGENAERAATLVNTQTITIERLTELNNQIIETGKRVEAINKTAAEQRLVNQQKRKELEANLINSVK